jgi:hypothetical protein
MAARASSNSPADSDEHAAKDAKNVQVLRDPQKVHRSAICIVPPEELWAPIQGIRRLHDKASGPSGIP